jgi:alginate O-acetyltransferase complex protein AlgI
VVFSSISFLVYFLPVVLLIYVLAPKSFKNWLLLLSSILFYSWGAPRFIFALLLTTLLDFYLVRYMHREQDDRKRKLLLVLSVSMNLGILFFFKYSNFFIANINAVLGAAGIDGMPLLQVILPVGISFYTFETITYVVDVYRRVHAPLDRLHKYLLYIILFPKLIAGPIIRYHEIADQMTGHLFAENARMRLQGFYRFTLGLCKKVFIANTMAYYADMTFNGDPHGVNAAEAWIGAISYTFQIYFDFSGYSDMAIGLGQMFGFIFPENFNNPYTSGSITEFWKRWHITLGNWMRNYLYIPLGGNQLGNKRTYINLWLVFIASGFWHGAAWTFLAWGLYHGLLMVLERSFLLNVYERFAKPLTVALSFILVAIGWIVFRSETLSQAQIIISRLFSADYRIAPEYCNTKFIGMFTLAAIFSFYGLTALGKKLQSRFYTGEKSWKVEIAMYACACCLFTLAVGGVSASSFNPFIYFRF